MRQAMTQIANCQHDWSEEYYGHRCRKCDFFYAHGTAPWDDEEDEPTCSHCGKPFYDFSDIGCGYCDQRSPEWGTMFLTAESPRFQ